MTYPKVFAPVEGTLSELVYILIVAFSSILHVYFSGNGLEQHDKVFHVFRMLLNSPDRELAIENMCDNLYRHEQYERPTIDPAMLCAWLQVPVAAFRNLIDSNS
ncbi:hypothetical protein TNCV_1246681 [Trichonephila clavipes]|uniref:Uncharacterized protein n=1 Tax=Trichonephila clavipes TaxID=2585209 RepID=A0A8X6RA54_TRICX|nr:hypothetical protein TNCV_1246681 [Trichonephila clavipes]